MKSLVKASLGTFPPQPTEDTLTGEVFHGYNGPLIGLIRQHGHTYLYNCLAGEMVGSSDLRVFAYVQVESDREWPVYDDEMEMSAAILLEFADKPVVVTVSDDLAGVMEIIEIPQGEGLRESIVLRLAPEYPELITQLNYLPL